MPTRPACSGGRAAATRSNRRLSVGATRAARMASCPAAANWPTVAIQFVAETTFQVLVAIPSLGAAVHVSVVVGEDLTELLQGALRDTATRTAGALAAEPVALVSFGVAFGIALAAASI